MTRWAADPDYMADLNYTTGLDYTADLVLSTYDTEMLDTRIGHFNWRTFGEGWRPTVARPTVVVKAFIIAMSDERRNWPIVAWPTVVWPTVVSVVICRRLNTKAVKAFVIVWRGLFKHKNKTKQTPLFQIFQMPFSTFKMSFKMHWMIDWLMKKMVWVFIITKIGTIVIDLVFYHIFINF